jgi:hypothetical protein
LPFIVDVIVDVGEVKGEGEYWKDCLHCRPGGVAGYSKKILQEMTETHFGVTEMNATTAGACLM